ncbi:hypothetical protein HPB51_011969 [Rhipicephalus microplus]|uniref:cyclin-dependent kinase n=1 Tax=Rhipicephalus microplus TaxID=6941 RepID=A0A9J6F1G9_RHIMP|nr:hypothetical protein HPB51_011969 [Rhipicephalus microplus]
MTRPGADTSLTNMAGDVFTNGSAYEEIAQIGTGAFGTVYKARDRQNEGRFVALKKVRVSLNEEGIPTGTLREIGLLRQLDAAQHPNVVRLLDICHGNRLERELVLFLVFEHIDQDLAGFLERCPEPGLEPDLIASLLKQLLTGVEFLHSHRIVHRDLKPQNVLVTAQRQLKLADFGLARLYEREMSLTPVVVTLWYRPPEQTTARQWIFGAVVVSWLKWHAASLSLAVVPRQDQLTRILDIMGLPPADEWPADAAVSRQTFSNFSSCGTSLEQAVPQLEGPFMDLLRQMLRFCPHRRITAKAALAHPCLADVITVS